MEDHTKCPDCYCRMSHVIETRDIDLYDNYWRVRIRMCRACGRKFRTKEVVDDTIKWPSSRDRSKPNNLDLGAPFDE